MKNLDLNAFGVSELSETQTRDVNGGIVFELIVIGIALVGLGYQIGADRAAMDNK